MLLEVKNLTARYGAVTALKEISFDLDEGEIVAMIGPNGAGKSTALKAVSGILEATDGTIESGEILFEGESIKGLRTDELVAKGICLVPEGRRVFPTMTVLENLEMGAYKRKDKTAISQDIHMVLTLFPQLKERVKQKAGTLSTGEQQMLAMGRALMLKPKLLLYVLYSTSRSRSILNSHAVTLVRCTFLPLPPAVASHRSHLWSYIT